MKRILIIVILCLATGLAGAQTVVVNEKSKTVVRDKLYSYQMGTMKTVNSSCTITFETPLDVEYTIMLTPYTENAGLYIAEKTREKVVIRAKSGTDATFDYVVFIKRPAPAPATDKQE
jgi:hypothetical protein